MEETETKPKRKSYYRPKALRDAQRAAANGEIAGVIYQAKDEDAVLQAHLETIVAEEQEGSCGQVNPQLSSADVIAQLLDQLQYANQLTADQLAAYQADGQQSDEKISKREMFALHAIMAMSVSSTSAPDTYKTIARAAYKIADALIEVGKE
jgi:hypothetical protein